MKTRFWQAILWWRLLRTQFWEFKFIQGSANFQTTWTSWPSLAWLQSSYRHIHCSIQVLEVSLINDGLYGPSASSLGSSYHVMVTQKKEKNEIDIHLFSARLCSIYRNFTRNILQTTYRASQRHVKNPLTELWLAPTPTKSSISDQI